MGMGMHSAVFALVHAVVLLTVSFFVLLALRKVDTQSLKVFGYAIAVLLWVSAALVFGKGLAGHPMMHRMHMCGKMDRQMMGAEAQSQAPKEMPAK